MPRPSRNRLKPSPASAVTKPPGETLWTRWAPASDTKRFPLPSTVKLVGKKNVPVSALTMPQA